MPDCGERLGTVTSVGMTVIIEVAVTSTVVVTVGILGCGEDDGDVDDGMVVAGGIVAVTVAVPEPCAAAVVTLVSVTATPITVPVRMRTRNSRMMQIQLLRLRRLMRPQHPPREGGEG